MCPGSEWNLIPTFPAWRFLRLMAGSSGITIPLSDWKLITCGFNTEGSGRPRKIQPSAPSALLLWDGKDHREPGPARLWSSRGELAQSDALQHIREWELSPRGCNSKLGKARALEEGGNEQLLWSSIISLRLIIYILFISYGTLTVTLMNIIW